MRGGAQPASQLGVLRRRQSIIVCLRGLWSPSFGTLQTFAAISVATAATAVARGEIRGYLFLGPRQMSKSGRFCFELAGSQQQSTDERAHIFVSRCFCSERQAQRVSRRMLEGTVQQLKACWVSLSGMNYAPRWRAYSRADGKQSASIRLALARRIRAAWQALWQLASAKPSRWQSAHDRGRSRPRGALL